MIKRIIALGINLAIICGVAAGGLSVTYCLTRETIEKQIIEKQLKAAKEVLPEVKMNEDFKEREDLYDKLKSEFPGVDKVFEGYRDDEVIGYAVQMLPRGYGGPVTMVVGIGLDGNTTGISIVSHGETPGLGSLIEDPEWQKQFKGKTKSDQLEVKKDIDSISGATISAKAVAKGVKDALGVFDLIRSDKK